MIKRFSLLAFVIAVAISLVGPGTVARASAATLVQLPVPPAPSTLSSVRSGSCAASGSNVDGTIAGICKYTYGSTGGSGRGGGYKTPKTASFPATWTAFGEVVGLGAQCSCSPNYQGTGTVVVINGVAYYYVATAPNGDELVNSNTAGFLVLQVLPALPAAPTVTAIQSGTNLQISWIPDAAVADAISSSLVTVTRADGTGTNLTTTVGSGVTSASLGPVDAATAYVVGVVSIDAAGSSKPGTFDIITDPADQESNLL